MSCQGRRVRPICRRKAAVPINAKNIDQYADKLSEGTRALIKARVGYRVDVYPTHRSGRAEVVVGQHDEERHAGEALRRPDGSDRGATRGIPFPIPKNAAEVMFNFQLRYLGHTILMPNFSSYAVDSSGRRTLANQACCGPTSSTTTRTGRRTRR